MGGRPGGTCAADADEWFHERIVDRALQVVAFVELGVLVERRDCFVGEQFPTAVLFHCYYGFLIVSFEGNRAAVDDELIGDAGVDS